jgi:hypothetical protein
MENKNVTRIYLSVFIIYTVEYYFTIYKNEIMWFAGKWMELEIIMLNEMLGSERQILHVVYEDGIMKPTKGC